jgi:hypothetical protein
VTERFEFWKGVTVGMLAGMVAAALARCASNPQLAADGRGEVLKPSPRPAENPPRKDALELHLKRDDPESAGDPSLLSPEGAQSRFAAFERAGGAPGGAAEPEPIEVPGRPGERVDSAASAPLRIAPRSVNLHGGKQYYQLVRQDWSS